MKTSNEMKKVDFFQLCACISERTGISFDDVCTVIYDIKSSRRIVNSNCKKVNIEQSEPLELTFFEFNQLDYDKKTNPLTYLNPEVKSEYVKNLEEGQCLGA